MFTNHSPRGYNCQLFRSFTGSFVTLAIILLSTAHLQAVSSLVVVEKDAEKLTQTAHPILYKCSNSNLPDELELPKILLEIRNTKPENDSFGSAVFQLYTTGAICENQLELSLNLTNSSRKDDLCNYWIESDGTFNILDDGWFKYKPERFCISRLSKEALYLYLCDDDCHGDPLLTAHLNCSDQVLSVHAVGDGEVLPVAQVYKGYVILVGSLVCAVIDIAIILVYITLSDNQSCYGWSTVAMLLSMLSFYIGMASVPAISFAHDAMPIPELALDWLCYSSVLTTQLSFLCTYCWTTVLAYDVWRKLCKLSSRSSCSRGLRSFLLYCAFGCGLPLLVVAISLAVFSFSPTTDCNSPNSCRGYIQFFRIWFVYLPSGIVLGCNVVLMYLTLKHLREAKKNRGDLRVHGKSEGNSSYTNAVLICKLMVLMGAFLLLDMVIHFLDVSRIGESIYSLCFEYTYRIIHSACLVWIFVWNDEIRGQMAAKFSFLAPYIIQKSGGSTPAFQASPATALIAAGKKT